MKAMIFFLKQLSSSYAKDENQSVHGSVLQIKKNRKDYFLHSIPLSQKLLFS